MMLIRSRLQRHCPQIGIGLLAAAAVAAVVLHARGSLADNGQRSGDDRQSAASAQDDAAPNTAVQPANPSSPQEPTPEQQAALEEGKAMYRGLCSGCHGGAGRGGKGPNLTDDRWLHGGTDADIARVIQNGVPRTTMKKLGESLTDEQISKIIAYIRLLGQAPAESNWQPYLPGDAAAGERLFFDEKGKTQCSKCHSVNHKGGRVGPALDQLALRRSPEYVMESILQSSKFIDPQYQAVQVVTKDGKVITGLRVNESNFSIQLREENGRFHSLLKRDLDEFTVLETSLMPNNFAEQLTVKQLHDLFAFLMTLE